jgi:hypothetical protein
MNKIIDNAHSSPECGIEMIFDTIIGSTFKEGSNFSPFIPKLCMIFEQYLIFFFGPLATIIKLWCKMIMPSINIGYSLPFSALFPRFLAIHNFFMHDVCNLFPF